ncbi:hypothetical protein [Nonomuraea endophytica]|uniref:hypothetical protein n=1 Tax=Nonomuraea endophytica TaxID=714136 RepID=UPI0037C86718
MPCKRHVSIEALGAGASGFVLKGDPPEQLIAAVRTVAAGDALLSPNVTRRVIAQFTRVAQPMPPKEFHDLTARELEIFQHIARGLSNVEIGLQLHTERQPSRPTSRISCRSLAFATAYN